MTADHRMTPKRLAALEWIRDDGLKLGLPERNEPSLAMLRRLENDNLAYFGSLERDDGRGERWGLTDNGREALAALHLPEQRQ